MLWYLRAVMYVWCLHHSYHFFIFYDMFGFYIVIHAVMYVWCLHHSYHFFIFYDMFGFYIVIKIIIYFIYCCINLENPIFDFDAVVVHYSNQDTWSLNVDKHAFPIHNPNQANTPPDRWLRSGFQFPVTYRSSLVLPYLDRLQAQTRFSCQSAPGATPSAQTRPTGE
jgi:hypothetical protein